MSDSIIANKQLVLQPPVSFSGTIELPGSKSLSNRVLLLASLAKGTTQLHRLLASDDVRHMRNALALLGVTMAEGPEKDSLLVHGLGGPIKNRAQKLFLGNAGTAMRPLVAALCLGEGEYLLEGEPRMHERPIADLVEALQQAGAAITYTGQPGYPPLRIHASGLDGGEIRVRGNVSSQFLTALLMAAPMAREPLRIRVVGDLISRPYIKITIEQMRLFGVQVTEPEPGLFVVGHGLYTSPGTIAIEGDASAASYFLAAGAIAGGPVRICGAGRNSVQGDVEFAHVLARMGAKITWGDDWIEASRGDLHGIDENLNAIPDAAMTVAMLALFGKGPSVLRGIGSWRVKETDRISAMATELRKLGAHVEAGDDFLAIHPPTKFSAATIATYNDHRMAMCFSLACLGGVPITILDPDCVNKTYPGYFADFLGLYTSL